MIEPLDALAVQRVILISHSFGAGIAHLSAPNHPERVKRLIFIDGSLMARSQKIDLATLLFLIPGLGEWPYTCLRRDPQAAYQTPAPYYKHAPGECRSSAESNLRMDGPRIE